ncbi:hypothetical protein [Aliiglaciecola sp. LCG003]|uniref:hypothetical protein n=1 Tax=Aliiglaciecola sp. LCG003 TaxID=3053655 RepID=UPI00257266D8|nr:hypothetical protein [Aliiglaciecola sp. LCG003]WJG07797.1 hypothetical protein QR722_10500 [Aliiglaciecola sp. LCG003]
MTLRVPRMLKISSLLVTSVSLLLIPMTASANNVGGVFGPVINPTDKSLMFRYATSPGENGGEDAIATRLHYQQALNTDFRLRLLAQGRDISNDFQYDSAAVELLWQFQHRQQGDWDSALRFDFRTRRGDRAESVGVNWTNQWKLADSWSARAVGSLAWQFGSDKAATGTSFSTRAQISYKTESKLTLGMDMFNSFGKIGDFGSFNDQNHAIGPTISGKAANMKYMFGYLKGVSDGARDDVFRFWLGTSF